MIKKAKTVFFTTALLVTVFTSQAFAGLTSAPVNPDYLKYLSEKTTGTEYTVEQTNGKTRTSDAGTVQIRRSGVKPSVFDTSHIRTTSVKSNRSGDDPVTKFSLLNPPSKVTGVKDQGIYGTCWAFATMASIESGFINAGLGTQDLSERHLAWWTYNAESAQKHAFTKIALASNQDETYDQGGTNFMSMAILSRWTGPVEESKCLYSGIGKDTVASGLTPFAQLKNAYLLSNKDALGNINNDDIKAVLQSGQAVYVSFSWDSSFYAAGTCSYYRPTKVGNGGHAVTIVGFDDDYASTNFKSGTTPTGNGAWLIRNSWGRDWGNDGTFWISYEDPNLNSFTQFQAQMSDFYTNQYSYDPLGFVNSSGIGTETVYTAAIFATEGDSAANIPEVIKAVGFYATAPNIQYVIDVYTKVTAGKPRSGTKATSTYGTFAKAGYHTIVLPEEAVVYKGDLFSVIVKVTGPTGVTLVIPTECVEIGTSEDATANAGETFYSADGTTWGDIYSTDPKTSICIKALGDEVIPTKASNLLPVSGKEGVALNPLLKIRAFSASYGVAHKATRWQLSINNSFESGLIIDTGDDTVNLLEYQVPAGKLDYNTTYYWRASQKGVNNEYSDWSAPTSFKTVAEGVTPTPDSGGGGCNTGFLPMVFLMGLSLVVIRKNKK